MYYLIFSTFDYCQYFLFFLGLVFGTRSVVIFKRLNLKYFFHIDSNMRKQNLEYCFIKRDKYHG